MDQANNADLSLVDENCYIVTMDNIILYAIPAFIALIVIEWLVSWRKQHPVYGGKDTAACLAMGVGNVIISAATAGLVLMLYLWLYEHRIFDIPMIWWSWLILLFAEDFCYYWFHRAHHRIRFMWAAHVNHHSSEKYNLAVALRQSWMTPVTGNWLFWAPLALLGFPPAMILTQKAINLLYQFWIHTELVNRLGPLEWIFNTPSHHRVHHGSNPQYIDKNYAGIFIIWDRLFGTFEPEGDKVQFGLTKNIDTYNPVRIAFHEFASIARDAGSASNWRDRLRYVFGLTGWKPDTPNHQSAR